MIDKTDHEKAKDEAISKLSEALANFVIFIVLIGVGAGFLINHLLSKFYE